jgi:hypothetical protein
MFGWGKRKKKAEKPRQADPAAQGHDEWDFLRAQADHDADLMAEVRGPSEDALAEEEAAAVNHFPAPDEPAQAEAPGLLDFPDPEEPRRAPRRVERSVVPAAPEPRADEHATKPLTLLSELCAKFQDPSEARPEWDRFTGAPAGWTLTLELTVGGRTFQRTVTGEAVLGRSAPESEKPDIDLALDDTVSRRHARIYTRAGAYWLRDLESMNGTRHNGEWLQPGGEAQLAEGDEIALGELCRIRVVDPVMRGDDQELREFLQVALGGTQVADREILLGWGPQEVTVRADVLDVALERGNAVGLLEEPEIP